jgi:hypothetical protein
MKTMKTTSAILEKGTIVLQPITCMRSMLMSR